MSNSSEKNADKLLFWYSSVKKTTFKSSIKYLKSCFYLYLLSFCSFFLRRESVAEQSCDVLLIQASEKVIGYNRKAKLKERLKDENIVLREIAVLSDAKVLLHRLLLGPIQSKGFKYFFLKAYSKFLVCKYNPKIILNDRNGSLLSIFLKDEIDRKGGVFVQLAHATTTEDSRKLALNDYHYYFLFGMSSYDSLMKRKVLIGESKAVIVGSHMIDTAYDMPLPIAENKTVLLLGVGPDREKQDLGMLNYQVIYDWIKTRPDITLLVKAHPRSSLEFWGQKDQLANNIKLLEKNLTLSDALNLSSVVISIMSNAIIEAALTKRPLICVDATNSKDIFTFESMCSPICRNKNDLNSAYNMIQDEFDRHIERSYSFGCYHLSNGFNGLDKTVSVIKDILQNKCVDYLSLTSK